MVAAGAEVVLELELFGFLLNFIYILLRRHSGWLYELMLVAGGILCIAGQAAVSEIVVCVRSAVN